MIIIIRIIPRYVLRVGAQYILTRRLAPSRLTNKAECVNRTVDLTRLDCFASTRRARVRTCVKEGDHLIIITTYYIILSRRRTHSVTEVRG